MYGPDGAVLARCRDDFAEDLRVVSLARPGTVTPSDPDKVLDAIVATLRRFDAQIFPFKPKWIIGLSGGIDSSITASALRMALDDPDRIVGYNLATRYNSDVTKANAYNLAQALGIRLVNGSIEEVVDATQRVLSLYGYEPDQVSGLAQENVQARLRGHMLSTFAQIEGGVIMNNGNKVEIMMGYATLYGDSIGAISPIGDLTKVQLFDTGARHKPPIRLRGSAREPDARRDGKRLHVGDHAQRRAKGRIERDPMKWFYHDWLVHQLVDYPGYGTERVMRAYLKNKLADTEAGKWIRYYGLEDPQAFIEDLEWVLRQMRISVFKRIRMPPNITLSRGSFGFDFRENQAIYEQTDSYRALKQQILSQA